jgi:hypothetical protein
VTSWVANINYVSTGAIANLVIPLPQWAGEVSGFYQVVTTALVKNATIVDLSYAVQNQVLSGGGYPFGVIQSYPPGIDAAAVPVTFNLPPTQCAVILDVPATGTTAISLIGVGN